LYQPWNIDLVTIDYWHSVQH